MTSSLTVVANSKGGVGKTTIISTLASMLVATALQNKRRMPLLISIDEQHNLPLFFEIGVSDTSELLLFSATPATANVTSMDSLRQYYLDAGVAILDGLGQDRDILVDVGANAARSVLSFFQVIKLDATAVKKGVAVRLLVPIVAGPGAIPGAIDTINAAATALPSATKTLVENRYTKEKYETYEKSPELLWLRENVKSVTVHECDCSLWQEAERIHVPPYAFATVADEEKAFQLLGGDINNNRALGAFRLSYSAVVEWGRAVESIFAPILGITLCEATS